MSDESTTRGVETPIDIPGLRPIRLLGQGGMARVYLAEQDQPRRQVVVKIVSPEKVPARFMEVLKVEGDTAAQFEHDNLITIHACGVIDDHYYQVMPYLSGGDLADRLREGLPPDEATSIVRRIASALDHIHARGFVHRDMKPGNILFTESGKPVLADFGIAKAVDSVGILTEAGYTTGTPVYMSPEQVLGNPLDARSDLYSLGVVFHEALTGSPPFQADSDHKLKQAHVSAPVPRLPRSLAPLQPILDRLLAKHPDDRYPDAQSLIEDLDALPDLTDLPTPQPGTPTEAADDRASFAEVTTWVREMSRRRVFRVMAIYVAAAWGFTEMFTTVSETLAWPDWTRTTVVVLFILGFPVAMLLSWLFDIGPGGVYRASPSSRKGMAAILGSVATLIAATAIIVIYVRPGAPSEEAPREVEPPLVAAEIPPQSVAVLPFADMSPAGDQEYFSEGISEELISLLGRVEGLKVPARTSAFKFKDADADVGEIGRALRVATVLEGSVRKAGDRVRITAQLIDADDGYHLWSETYDRELADIFAIQDEIAHAIVDALKVELGLEGQLARGRTTDSMEAYDLYLAGRHIFNERGQLEPEQFRRAIELFERAVALDPDFAPAWAGIADYFSILPSWNIEPQQEARALEAARKAVQLDPGSAEVQASLGMALGDVAGEVEQGRVHLRKAIELNPGYAEAYHWLGTDYLHHGNLNEALPLQAKAVELDPLHVNRVTWYARALGAAGHDEQARSELLRMLEYAPDNGQVFDFLFHEAFESGRFAEAYRWVSRWQVAQEDAEICCGPAIHYQRIKLEVALARFETATSLIDEMRKSRTPEIMVAGGRFLLLNGTGQFAELQEFMNGFIELDLPGGMKIRATNGYAHASLLAGDVTSAIEVLEGMEHWGGSWDHQSFGQAHLAYAYLLDGRPEAARDLAAETLALLEETEANGNRRPRMYYRQAMMLALLGRHEEAFDKLDQAYERGWRHYHAVTVRPFMDKLIGGEARYKVFNQRALADIERMRAEVEAKAIEDES